VSLIKCPECSKEISDQAKVCPHCGYTISPSKRHPSLPLKILAGICALIAILVLLSGFFDFSKSVGASKKSEETPTDQSEDFQWSLEDLSLFDRKGSEVFYLTEKNKSIRLSDEEGLSTFRGIKIGDNAKNALNTYDTKDFIFEFTPAHYIDKEKSTKSYNEATALTEKYSDKSPKEMLDNLDDISLSDCNFYYSIKLYEFGEKIYTESNIPAKTDDSDHEYMIFFYIENAKIKDVVLQFWKI